MAEKSREVFCAGQCAPIPDLLHVLCDARLRRCQARIGSQTEKSAMEREIVPLKPFRCLCDQMRWRFEAAGEISDVSSSIESGPNESFTEAQCQQKAHDRIKDDSVARRTARPMVLRLDGRGANPSSASRIHRGGVRCLA